jgi:hypothetical protein
MILYQKISKYSDDLYIDLLDHLFIHIVKWVDSNEEIKLLYDFQEIRLLFFYFILNKKHNNDNYDLKYDLKYSDDLTNIFITMKNISNSYCTNILERKTSYDLLEFCMNISYIEEIYHDNEENYHENELNENYNF